MSYAEYRAVPTDETAFRVRTLRVGVLTTWAVAFFVVAYAALTWSEPHRTLVVLVALAACAEAAVVARLTTRLVADPVYDSFVLGWCSAHVGVATLVCALDGGINSPFLAIFFMSVAFAGGALRRRHVILVASLNVLAVVALALVHTSHGHFDPSVVIWAGALIVIAGVCASIAEHRTARNAELTDAREELPRRLARVVEYRDDDTGGHVERMAGYAALVARSLGLSPAECRRIRLASTMHDIGKVAVPDAVLLKPGRLTPEERAVMETHAQAGHDMLTGSGSELLDLAATIALTHHEHYDGNGYPNGLIGEDIPLAGRIVAVADVFDAITSKRVYKDAESVDTAAAIIRDGAGTQFDPVVVEAFGRALDAIVLAKGDAGAVAERSVPAAPATTAAPAAAPLAPEVDPRPYRQLVVASGLFSVVVGLVVLAGGWLLDVRELRTVIPGAVGMKAQTAVLLACGGLALVLLAPGDASAWRTRWARLFATVPAAVGLAVLGEYVFGWNLGIDEWPFADTDGRAADIKYPGRFAPTTGVCFVLLTAALLTLDAGRSWRWRPFELCAVPLAVVSAMSLIGYAYSIPEFYGPASAAKMAVHTAACFILLAGGILLARPHGRLLALATTTDPGGIMLRRLLPLAIVGPIVLGWLHLRTVGTWAWFNFEVGTWWLAAATSAGLATVVWACAATLSRGDRTRRQLEGRLYELANSDDLTGLANRRRFDEELAQFMAYGRRYGRPGALVVIDLDGFKQVNDRNGHAAGDRVLAAVAEVLSTGVRATDAVARLGGDEFGIILRELSAADAERIAADLVAAIASRLATLGGDGVTVTASAGIAHVTDYAAVDAEGLLRRADVAMYRAKLEGGNVVSPPLDDRVAALVPA